MISRRKFINSASLTSAAAVAMPQLFYSSLFQKAPEYVTVEITHGKIRGERAEGVNIFRGIPYGGKISGDRRFRRPAALEPWAGVRDALRLGNPAIQMPNQTYGLNEPEPAEDCLFLNV